MKVHSTYLAYKEVSVRNESGCFIIRKTNNQQQQTTPCFGKKTQRNSDHQMSSLYSRPPSPSSPLSSSSSGASRIGRFQQQRRSSMLILSLSLFVLYRESTITTTRTNPIDYLYYYTNNGDGREEVAATAITAADLSNRELGRIVGFTNSSSESSSSMSSLLPYMTTTTTTASNINSSSISSISSTTTSRTSRSPTTTTTRDRSDASSSRKIPKNIHFIYISKGLGYMKFNSSDLVQPPIPTKLKFALEEHQPSYRGPRNKDQQHHTPSPTTQSIPQDKLDIIRQWKVLHPPSNGWNVTVWDDSKVISWLVSKQKHDTIQLLSSIPITAWTTDLLRIFILNEFGGIYVDTDIVPLLPLDPLVEWLQEENYHKKNDDDDDYDYYNITQGGPGRKYYGAFSLCTRHAAAIPPPDPDQDDHVVMNRFVLPTTNHHYTGGGGAAATARGHGGKNLNNSTSSLPVGNNTTTTTTTTTAAAATTTTINITSSYVRYYNWSANYDCKQMQNAVMGSIPNHPIIKHMLDRSLSNTIDILYRDNNRNSNSHRREELQKVVDTRWRILFIAGPWVWGQSIWNSNKDAMTKITELQHQLRSISTATFTTNNDTTNEMEVRQQQNEQENARATIKEQIIQAQYGMGQILRADTFLVCKKKWGCVPETIKQTRPDIFGLHKEEMSWGSG